MHDARLEENDYALFGEGFLDIFKEFYADCVKGTVALLRVQEVFSQI